MACNRLPAAKRNAPFLREDGKLAAQPGGRRAPDTRFCVFRSAPMDAWPSATAPCPIVRRAILVLSEQFLLSEHFLPGEQFLPSEQFLLAEAWERKPPEQKRRKRLKVSFQIWIGMCAKAPREV